MNDTPTHKIYWENRYYNGVKKLIKLYEIKRILKEFRDILNVQHDTEQLATVAQMEQNLQQAIDLVLIVNRKILGMWFKSMSYEDANSTDEEE